MKGYSKYEKDCAKQLKKQYQGEAVKSRVFLRLKYFLADRREPDVFNLDNAMGDILQNAQIIADDKQVNSCYATKVAIDRKNPRVEIEMLTDVGELGEISK